MTNENSRRPVLLAWIHSHVQSVSCNFSSVDVHTQHTFAKVYDGILGLVVELNENGQLGKYDFFEMTVHGERMVEKCSRKKNCNIMEQHQSCNNDHFYKSSFEKVILYDDSMLDVRNFMTQPIGFQNLDPDMQHKNPEENVTIQSMNVQDHKERENLKSKSTLIRCNACRKKWANIDQLNEHVKESLKCQKKYDKRPS